MSVWEYTTYKLTLARQVYEQLHFMHTKILGKKCFPYLQPRGELVPIESDYDWDEVADVCEWDWEDPHLLCMKRIEKLTRSVVYWATGVEAIYQLIYACYRGKFEVDGQYDYDLIDKKLDALMSVVVASTLVTPESFKEMWRRGTPDLVREARRYERFSEGWKYFARSINTKSNKYYKINQEQYFRDGDRIYYGGHYKDLIIMVGSAEYKTKGLIFSRRHLDLLIGSSARIGCLIDHTAREHHSSPKLQRSIMKMLYMTITDAGKCGKRNVDKVVQAFHKARSYMQMLLFENQMEDTEETALLEFQSKLLQTVISLADYKSCFFGLERSQWLELLHVYKWMPPPDYDSTRSFTELHEHHMGTRKSGLSEGASAEMKRLWAMVVLERKMNIATAYRKLYTRWPNSLRMAGGNPTRDELQDWEPRGLFPYFTYGKDVSSQIKDKSTVCSKLYQEVSGNKSQNETNFLLWYLSNQDSVDTVVAGARLKDNILDEDNYARVAYKGEAHKPDSRLFFMAPPLQRILLGELEGNISRVASYYPASLQGMDSLTKSQELLKLFNVKEDVSGLKEEVTCYVVTFDLSKFSPKFNPEVLEDLHSFWADVFGYDPVKKMGDIGSKGVILHTTCNLVMSYENKGADLEGFRGRMMTLFHADLIAAACRYAKEKGFIVEKSVAAVFIDDGAVRIYAKGSGKVAKKNSLGFLKCMQEIYEAAGQENHPNKTIVSRIGGELLAEQYLLGAKQRCPIKAGMRLFTSCDHLCVSIADEFDSLFATAQGSVKDMCLWVVAYRRLAEAYIKVIYRWGRKSFRGLQDVKFAFKMVTPKSLGGFGFPTMQQLVSTTGYNSTIEGLGILNSAARMFPEYESIVRKILDRSIIVRSPLQVLKDPTRVRMTGPVLVEGRLVAAVLAKLSRNRGPFAHHVLLARDEDLIEHATKVAEALLSQDTYSLPVLQRVWESTPLAYLESIVQKFSRSSSIVRILDQQDVNRIRNANARDVRDLLSCFFND